MELREPLSNGDAKALVMEILAIGRVRISRHAGERIAERNMASTDCINVLRCGWVAGAELQDGTWRYRVLTQRMTVVIAIRSETTLSIVTAWRNES